MYGTFSRLQPKAGQHQAVLDRLFRWEQEQLPTVRGYVRGYVFESAPGAETGPVDILLIVVFDSQASYTRHRDDPHQARWEQQLADLVEQAPQWHEGEFTELFAQPRGL
jgi:quinol monooxygenase YgiN